MCCPSISCFMFVFLWVFELLVTGYWIRTFISYDDHSFQQRTWSNSVVQRNLLIMNQQLTITNAWLLRWQFTMMLHNIEHSAHHNHFPSSEVQSPSSSWTTSSGRRTARLSFPTTRTRPLSCGGRWRWARDMVSTMLAGPAPACDVLCRVIKLQLYCNCAAALEYLSHQ